MKEIETNLYKSVKRAAYSVVGVAMLVPWILEIIPSYNIIALESIIKGSIESLTIGGIGYFGVNMALRNMKKYEGLKEEVVRGQKELKYLKKFTENTINCIGVNIDVVNKDYKIEFANKELTKIFGDIEGATCYEVYLGQDRPCPDCPIQKAIETLEVSSGCVMSIDGRSYEVISVPFENEDGTILAIGSRRDITEIKRLEQKVKESYSKLMDAYAGHKVLDRMKDEFVSNVSHELRTPLTVAKGGIDLILDENLTGNGRKVMLNSKKSLTRLNHLIGDLIEVARMEKQSNVLNMEYLDINAEVDRSIREFTSAAEANKVTIETCLQDGLPNVRGDKKMLQRALSHLIDNAIKFNMRGGSVIMRTRRTNGHVEVSIDDTGIGIGKDYQDKIFGMFYQVDGSMTRKYPGTGSGLAIVKKAVEMHKGRVWVESEVGNGSRFAFMLPLNGVPPPAVHIIEEEIESL